MNPSASLPIGIFDSGMGGLTVLKAISGRLPGENLLYLGDTARLPYGTKSRDTIIRYTLKAAGRLVDEGVKMLVVACNTATCAALPELREHFAPLPVLGVVRPGAEAAVAASRNKRIVVIATEATIAGGAYQQAIASLCPEARVQGRACTLFVPLAEEGWMDGPIVEGIAIGKPMRGEEILRLAKKHGVRFVHAPEDKILEARAALARKGVYCEHTTAANYAAYLEYRRLNGPTPDTLLTMCGAGLKSDH